MTPRRRVGLLLLALAVCAGCAAPGVRPEVLQGFVGKPADTLVRDWGTPTREVPDGDGRILVYEEVARQKFKATFDENDVTGRRDNYAIAQASANTAYRAPTVYVRSYLFWVNQAGTVVHAEVRTP